MVKTTSLSHIRPGLPYVVAGYKEAMSDYSKKLNKMGFVKGTQIELAPVKLSDPMVVRLRGSRIALRKKEAEQVLVEEVSHA